VIRRRDSHADLVVDALEKFEHVGLVTASGPALPPGRLVISAVRLAIAAGSALLAFRVQVHEHDIADHWSDRNSPDTVCFEDVQYSSSHPGVPNRLRFVDPS
jgi:hypothetical protein